MHLRKHGNFYICLRYGCGWMPVPAAPQGKGYPSTEIFLFLLKGCINLQWTNSMSGIFLSLKLHALVRRHWHFCEAVVAGCCSSDAVFTGQAGSPLRTFWILILRSVCFAAIWWMPVDPKISWSSKRWGWWLCLRVVTITILEGCIHLQWTNSMSATAFSPYFYFCCLWLSEWFWNTVTYWYINCRGKSY